MGNLDLLTRYARQIILPEIGQEGQERLAHTRILCVGAGGLGSPALLYLVAAGVGHIGIIDADMVDESNLQRQILFNEMDIGISKASCAKAKLSSLNSSTNFEIYEERLTSINSHNIIPNYDIIIDCSDNFQTKFLISDSVVKYQKVMIFGAIQGFDGMASVFDFRPVQKTSPCYRCLIPSTPRSSIQNCAEAGVIGAVAGIIGTTQALQAIQISVGHKSFSPLVGKIWTINMTTMDVSTHILNKSPTCPICHTNKEAIVLQYTSPTCGIIPEISPSQITKEHDTVLIDVREQQEWDSGHIPGAMFFPLSALSSGNIPALPQDKCIIVYCQTGRRSQSASILLKEYGYQNVRNMKGGYAYWCSMNENR
jgi:adenylyltransferase/sulfurtransferase